MRVEPPVSDASRALGNKLLDQLDEPILGVLNAPDGVKISLPEVLAPPLKGWPSYRASLEQTIAAAERLDPAFVPAAEGARQAIDGYHEFLRSQAKDTRQRTGWEIFLEWTDGDFGGPLNESTEGLRELAGQLTPPPEPPADPVRP